MNKKIKVVRLEKQDDSVSEDQIEESINNMLAQGWSFLQINTGAYRYGRRQDKCSYVWVYLIFEKESTSED